MNKENGNFYSPVINPIRTQACFSFYYYMFGPKSQVSLALFVNQSNGLIHSEDIWSGSLSHHDRWHRMFVTVSPQNKPFSVYIFILIYN